MDVVCVMAAYLLVVRVCLEMHSRECLSRLCSTHTHHEQICCHDTDNVHINGQGTIITVILASTV